MILALMMTQTQSLGDSENPEGRGKAAGSAVKPERLRMKAEVEGRRSLTEPEGQSDEVKPVESQGSAKAVETVGARSQGGADDKKPRCGPILARAG